MSRRENTNSVESAIVFASVATSANGYMDDNSPQRLIISSTEDWQEVYRLRGQCDAIMVGAETIRRDNPSLRIKGEGVAEQRHRKGLTPELVRVTLTNSGDLSSDLKFFTAGDGERIVFTSNPKFQPPTTETTVIYNATITAQFIAEQLALRGIRNLFLEGGNKVLTMFFEEDMVDDFRLAVNPNIVVDDPTAPKLNIGDSYKSTPCKLEALGGVEVRTYTLHPKELATDHDHLMMAIEQGRLSTPSATSYCVGAVIVTRGGEITKGYTHETSPTHHAEQEAIKKALALGLDLRGATIYSSMEPCSKRASEPESCSALIIRYGFARVVFAYLEPSFFVDCCGTQLLRENGVEVVIIDSLAQFVIDTNRHIIRLN